MSNESVLRFEQSLAQLAPYMRNAVAKPRAMFDDNWEREFDETLLRMFGNDPAALANAVRGYVRFALDATKLQKYFERERKYRATSYEAVKQLVYHNADYMLQLYLPGILLSSYLWPHHYRQLLWFRKEFVPLLRAAGEKSFCDVGVGTGFYSRQLLAADAGVTGVGYDISPHSLQYATRQVAAFGYAARWQGRLEDAFAHGRQESWPFIVSVEVLEHLERPEQFLAGLRRLLRPGGRGFITAAITAPNEDHIYLYNNADEVRVQLNAAGFVVLNMTEEWAYEPKNDEPVPRLAAFIVG